MNLLSDHITEQTLPEDMDQHGQDAVIYLGLVKLKLFAPDGMTLYCTDRRDIGKPNQHDYFHSLVASG